MKRYLLAGAAALALVAAAVAQTQISAGVSGAEVVVIAQGGPGGPSIFTTTGRLTSGPAYAYFTSFPATFTIGATTATAGIITGGALNINAAGTGTTVYTFPPTSQLIDGEEIAVCNLTASAWSAGTNTIAANTNQTLVGSGTLSTLAASSCAQYQWIASAATWFKTTM